MLSRLNWQVSRKFVRSSALPHASRIGRASATPLIERTILFSTNAKRPENGPPKPNVYKQLLNESLNVPNSLTLARLFSTPGLAYLIWIDKYELAIVACFFTGILDWLDGYLARKWNQFTVLGSFLDPLADKVFVGALLGTLTVKGLFPWQLAALVIGRDVALLGGSFIYRAITKPPEVEFFATTGQGVIEVKPTFISKVNTVLQMSIMGFALTKAAYGYPTPELFNGMCWIVAGTTVGSGFSYMDLTALRNRGKVM